MEERQWKEVLEKVKLRSFMGRSNFMLAGVCIGCMARVYDCVMNGWAEHKDVLKENIKAVGMAVFEWYNRMCSDYGISSMADIMESLNKITSIDEFKAVYTSFCYDVGMLVDSIVYERKDVETFAWYIVCDYIDITFMFMSQKEFYNLMMGIEKEDEEDV